MVAGRRDGPPPSPITGFEDWPAHARTTDRLQRSDPQVQALADVLGLRAQPARPVVRTGPELLVDGVEVAELGWPMPYGPPTRAWLLRPAGVSDPLPGVLALHPHGGRRSTGARQLVDLSPAAEPALANRLAGAGFAVLAHDAFSWDSRRFDLRRPPPKLAATLRAHQAWWREQGHRPTPEEEFDLISGAHEELLAKTAGLLGQTFAGLVVADDLVALDVLGGLPGVDPGRLAAVGFSGGGGRAHLLGALDDRLGAVVVAGMMATFGSLLPGYVEAHSWLLHSPGLWGCFEWPELARVGGARELLVLYGEDDPLFPLPGMLAADRYLREVPGYQGRFFPVRHELTPPMQQVAASFLRAWADRRLSRPAPEPARSPS